MSVYKITAHYPGQKKPDMSTVMWIYYTSNMIKYIPE